MCIYIYIYICIYRGRERERERERERYIVIGGGRHAIAFHTSIPHPIPYRCSIPSERVRNSYDVSTPP